VVRGSSPRLRSTALAIGAMFATNGMAFGSWVPRLPEVRDSLGVGDAALGLVLLGGGVGGLTMSLASGRIVDRFGSRRTMVATSLALSSLIPLIAIAPSPAVLFAVLVAIGALDGVTDVAQNAQAIELQRHRERSLLSRMHAAWSIGTLAGGLAASRAAAAGVSLSLQLGLTAIVLAAVCLTAAPHLLQGGSAPHLLAPSPALPGEVVEPAGTPDHPPAARAAPRRLLLLLFAMGAAAVLTEIPPTEWAALLMGQRYDVGPGAAGLAFVAFTAGMVVGRLGGDMVVDRIGSERTRRTGAVVALAGFVIIVAGSAPGLTLAGFSIAGLGASSQFPMAVRRAGELLGGSSRGVAVFAAGSRAGMLVASPVMGVLSAATSRSTALLVVAGGAAAVSALVRLPDPPVSPIT
jgi:MFS family permease